MSTYTIRLDMVRLLATANPYPYWDELLVVASLDVIGTVGGARRIVRSAGVRAADIGGVERGGERQMALYPSHGGQDWTMDIPDTNPGEEVQLAVVVTNVRGVPNEKVIAALMKLGLLAAEITAGVLIEVTDKALKVAKDVGLGVAGFLLDEVIDELFEDRPRCCGVVLQKSAACSPALLAERLYIPEEDRGHQDYHQVMEWHEFIKGDVENAPGERCSPPCAQIHYTIRKYTAVIFGAPVKFQRSYGAVDALPVAAILGNWVDDGLSVTPRVSVVIRRGTADLKDAVDVTVLERHLSPGGPTTTIVHREFVDRHLQWFGQLLPGHEVFGFPQPVALLNLVHVRQGNTGQRLFAPASALALAAETSPSMVGAGQHVDADTLFGADGAAEVQQHHQITLLSEIQHRGLDDHQVNLLFRRTACLPLSGSILLSFWTLFVKEGDKVLHRGVAIRYRRSDNLMATRTDCWLGKASPVK